jgi:hypothetical protein
MRKMILMAVAGYLWKKYQATKAAPRAARPVSAGGPTRSDSV